MGRDRTEELIEAFLAHPPFAVVGASRDRHKYGNKVLRAYQQRGLPVVAVNPHETEIEGTRCVPRLEDIDPEPGAVSIITPPDITEHVVEEAGRLGIRHLWMQPGAESEAALERAEQLGIEVIAGGPCALVVFGYRERG